MSETLEYQTMIYAQLILLRRIVNKQWERTPTGLDKTRLAEISNILVQSGPAPGKTWSILIKRT